METFFFCYFSLCQPFSELWVVFSAKSKKETPSRHAIVFGQSGVFFFAKIPKTELVRGRWISKKKRGVFVLYSVSFALEKRGGVVGCCRAARGGKGTPFGRKKKQKEQKSYWMKRGASSCTHTHTSSKRKKRECVCCISGLLFFLQNAQNGNSI